MPALSWRMPLAHVQEKRCHSRCYRGQQPGVCNGLEDAHVIIVDGRIKHESVLPVQGIFSHKTLREADGRVNPERVAKRLPETVCFH